MLKNISYENVLVYSTEKLQKFSEAIKECRKSNSTVLSTETLYKEPVYNKIKELQGINDVTQFRVSSSSETTSNCFGLIENQLLDYNNFLEVCPGSYYYNFSYMTLCEKLIEGRNVMNDASKTILNSYQNNSYIVPLVTVLVLVVVFIIIPVIYMMIKKYFRTNRQDVAEDGVVDQV